MERLIYFPSLPICHVLLKYILVLTENITLSTQLLFLPIYFLFSEHSSKFNHLDISPYSSHFAACTIFHHFTPIDFFSVISRNPMRSFLWSLSLHLHASQIKAATRLPSSADHVDTLQVPLPTLTDSPLADAMS